MALKSWRAVRDVLLRYRRELPVVLAIMTAAAGACFVGALLLPVELLLQFDADDLWFDADIVRVVGNMFSREFRHQTTQRHPILSLVTYLPFQLLHSGLGLPALGVIRLEAAVIAGAYAGVLYLALRLCRCRRVEAVAFVLLAGVSAAGMFWFAVPESFPLGGLSMLLALLLVAVEERYRVPDRVLAAAGAFTLGVTTSNWMVGLLAAFSLRPWRRALVVSAAALGAVLLLWGAQALYFNGVLPFWLPSAAKSHLRAPGPGVLAAHAVSFVFHTMIAPARGVAAWEPRSPPWMSFQYSQLGSGGGWGLPALLLWSSLLLLGAWGWRRTKAPSRLRTVLFLTLSGQFAIHAVFGKETFLYAAHFIGPLVLTAAGVVFTPARPLALPLAGLLVVCAGWNNVLQVGRARDHVLSHPLRRYRDEGLVNARLRRANLARRDLSERNLFMADLREARMQEANLRAAHLFHARLGGADLRGADLRGADLREAALWETDLRNANLRAADLRRADLSRADLRAADLTGARLQGAALRGALVSYRTRWPDGFDPGAAGAMLMDVPPGRRRPGRATAQGITRTDGGNSGRNPPF